MCILITIFLTFNFNQEEKCAFICPKTFDFLFQKNINFFKGSSLKKAVPEFQKYKKKWLSNLAKDLKNENKYELFHWYFFKDFGYFLGTPT